MRNLMMLVAMLFVPSSAFAQFSPGIEVDPPEAINALRLDLVDSFNKGDVDRLLSHLEPDVIVIWQNAEVCRGPDQVKAYYEKMMTGPNHIVKTVHSDPQVVDRQLHEDWAVSWGNMNDEFLLTDGSKFKLNSKFTATVVRRDDEWKVSSFHVSADLFDNEVLGYATKQAILRAGVSAGLGGLVVGFVISKLLRRKARMNWPAEVRRDPDGLRLLESSLHGDGVDSATAQLYRNALNSEKVRPLREQMERTAVGNLRDVMVVVVPGAFHREHRHTGADGQQLFSLTRELGCRVERVPIGSFDSLETNAKILLDFLARRDSESIVLVTLSKGGADVKTAIGMSPEAFRSVGTWVSFSGILNGTPLVPWLQKRRLRWLGARAILHWRGQSMETLRELRDDDGPLRAWPTLPDHLRLIQVLGFPLRRHLRHRWSGRGHRRLAPMGPNDGGGILLADALECPGEVYPVWSADHYLQPSWDIRPLLLALMRTALSHGSQLHTVTKPIPAK